MVPEHEALVAWWKSPAGRSRSQRMHEMNTSRATKQRALSLSGIQNQQKALPQIESTSENQQCFTTPEGVQMFGLPNSDSGRNSSAGEVNVPNFITKPDMPRELFDDQPLEATDYRGGQRSVLEAPSRLNQVENDVKDLKDNVSEILQRLRVYEGFPKVMEELLRTNKGQGDRTANAPFSVTGEGSQVDFSQGNISRRTMNEKLVVEGVAADVDDSTTREPCSRKRGFEEICSKGDFTVNDAKEDDYKTVAEDPLASGLDGGIVGIDVEETGNMVPSHGSSAHLSRGNQNSRNKMEETGVHQ
ncbi:hypothetical protein M758_UG266700 [Ceratodon purpureus]|nr:hypothetical protein M758_UG266700 [Ceratodon purpureus]